MEKYGCGLMRSTIQLLFSTVFESSSNFTHPKNFDVIIDYDNDSATLRFPMT
jgi:hypothetical protein